MGKMKQLSQIKNYIIELGGDGSVIDYLLMSDFEKSVYDLEKEVSNLVSLLKVKFNQNPHVNSYKTNDVCIYEVSVYKFHFHLEVSYDSENEIKNCYELNEWDELVGEGPILVGTGRSFNSLSSAFSNYQLSRNKTFKLTRKYLSEAKKQLEDLQIKIKNDERKTLKAYADNLDIEL